MSNQIDDKMLAGWRINYGLDTRTPAEAMRWWYDRMDGKAPAGAVAALGFCIDEIERLRADQSRQIERLRAALVAAMEVVQQDRTDMYIGSVHARTGELAPEDAEAIARLDAIIAQADEALGREG